VTVVDGAVEPVRLREKSVPPAHNRNDLGKQASRTA